MCPCMARGLCEPRASYVQELRHSLSDAGPLHTHLCRKSQADLKEQVDRLHDGTGRLGGAKWSHGRLSGCKCFCPYVNMVS